MLRIHHDTGLFMATRTPMPELHLDHLKTEIDYLQTEGRFSLEEAWKIEKFAIGAAAALVAWLATQHVESSLAWWLPFAVIAAGGIRFAAIMIHLDRRVSVYLRAREQAILGKDGGWHTWFGKQGPNQTIAHWLVWLLALAASGWIGMAHLQVKATADTSLSGSVPVQVQA